MLATGQVFEETVNLQGVAPSPTQNAYDIPLTIAKDVTLGDVTVNAMYGQSSGLVLHWG